jgi:uncharacterized protein YdeI (YjbR/CyaY-like superfamily)
LVGHQPEALEATRGRWPACATRPRGASHGSRYAPHPAIPELPAYIAKAFKANLTAWRHFLALARTYRRDFVVWIHTAKRPETRRRRIRESLELLSAGKRLGLK